MQLLRVLMDPFYRKSNISKNYLKTLHLFQVFQVIVHDAYNHSTHANDIAMLMLRTQATFNNLVQPACLWFDGVYDQIGTHQLTGTV